jgi:predicted PhzF superfamily epimerase YddE/YHI9
VTIAVKSDLSRFVDRIIVWMLDKIGDNNARVRENTEEAAITMAGHPAIGTSLWI